MSIITESPAPVNKELQFGKYKFVIFQEVEWPKTGGVDMDALPTKPVSLPLSRIRELRPAKTWKTWDNTVEIITASDHRLAVRGTLDEVVNKLNALGAPDKRKTRKPFEPFALTPREARIRGMRVSGYSINEIALAFNTGALRIAKEEAVIDKKLEAAAASRRRPRPMDEFADALHSGAGRDGAAVVLIPATEATLAMMKAPNIHPDAIT